MTINAHAVTTTTRSVSGGYTISVYTIQCDTCGTYDAAKSDAILQHKMVYFGWAAQGAQHTCPACIGLALGIERGRGEAHAPEAETR